MAELINNRNHNKQFPVSRTEEKTTLVEFRPTVGGSSGWSLDSLWYRKYLSLPRESGYSRLYFLIFYRLNSHSWSGSYLYPIQRVKTRGTTCFGSFENGKNFLFQEPNIIDSPQFTMDPRISHSIQLEHLVDSSKLLSEFFEESSLWHGDENSTFSPSLKITTDCKDPLDYKFYVGQDLQRAHADLTLGLPESHIWRLAQEIFNFMWEKFAFLDLSRANKTALLDSLGGWRSKIVTLLTRARFSAKARNAELHPMPPEPLSSMKPNTKTQIPFNQSNFVNNQLVDVRRAKSQSFPPAFTKEPAHINRAPILADTNIPLSSKTTFVPSSDSIATQTVTFASTAATETFDLHKAKWIQPPHVDHRGLSNSSSSPSTSTTSRPPCLHGLATSSCHNPVASTTVHSSAASIETCELYVTVGYANRQPKTVHRLPILSHQCTQQLTGETDFRIHLTFHHAHPIEYNDNAKRQHVFSSDMWGTQPRPQTAGFWWRIQTHHTFPLCYAPRGNRWLSHKLVASTMSSDEKQQPRPRKIRVYLLPPSATPQVLPIPSKFIFLQTGSFIKTR